MLGISQQLAPSLGLLGDNSYQVVDITNPVNLRNPLNRGLMVWYLMLPKFNEAGSGNGKFRDLVSKGANAGTYTNMATAPTSTSGTGRTTRPGGYGEVRCDGTNDSVIMPVNPGVQLNGVMTVSVWIYPTTVSAGTAEIIGEGQAGAEAYFLEINRTAAKISTYWGGVVIMTSAASVPVNTWTHVVLTRGGSVANWTVSFYFNGVLESSAVKTTGPAGGSTGILTVCTYSSNALYYTGFIDNIQIWNRALIASEVQALYNEAKTAFPTTLNRITSLFVKPSSAAPSVPIQVNTPWFGSHLPSNDYEYKKVSWSGLRQPANDYEHSYLRAVGE